MIEERKLELMARGLGLDWSRVGPIVLLRGIKLLDVIDKLVAKGADPGLILMLVMNLDEIKPELKALVTLMDTV